MPPRCRLNVDAKAAGVYSVTRAKSVAKPAIEQRQTWRGIPRTDCDEYKIAMKPRPIERGRLINAVRPPPKAGRSASRSFAPGSPVE